MLFRQIPALLTPSLCLGVYASVTLSEMPSPAIPSEIEAPPHHSLLPVDTEHVMLSIPLSNNLTLLSSTYLLFFFFPLGPNQ